MLPDTRQVGEPQIDHLDLLVRDRLEDIFDCGTIRNHGFTPATESGTLKVTLPSGALRSRRLGTEYTSPPRRRRAGLDPAWRCSRSSKSCHLRAGGFSSGAARA